MSALPGAAETRPCFPHRAGPKENCMDDTQRVALQAFCDEVELLIMEAQEKLAELKTALAQEE